MYNTNGGNNRMETIQKKLVREFFDGRVLIYEVQSFNDARGSLIELWREDDRAYQAKMCYWSETEPLFMRGPHEHRYQTDCFISYKNEMMYIFYDGKEKDRKEIFITDKNKVYMIWVKPGIIHGYRNISTVTALTGNFPDQLWKGYKKKEDVDEIRYEENINGKPMVVILGSQGRLGRAVTRKFLDAMKIDGIQVIPISEKIPVFYSQSINNMAEHIMKVRDYHKCENVYVINCIGKTVVNDLDRSESARKEAFWVNVDLPFLLGEKLSKNGIKLMHFSSDYVYQRYANENEKLKKKMKPLSVYTQTKKRYEDLLKEVYHSSIPPSIVVVRVSNLFSVDVNDQINIVMKLKRKMERNVIIEYDPQQEIGITDVRFVANWVYEVISNKQYFDGNTFINLRSPKMSIDRIIKTYFGEYPHLKERAGEFNNWFEEFYEDETVVRVDLPSSDASIREYISLISNSNR